MIIESTGSPDVSNLAPRAAAPPPAELLAARLGTTLARRRQRSQRPGQPAGYVARSRGADPDLRPPKTRHDAYRATRGRSTAGPGTASCPVFRGEMPLPKRSARGNVDAGFGSKRARRGFAPAGAFGRPHYGTTHRVRSNLRPRSQVLARQARWPARHRAAEKRPQGRAHPPANRPISPTSGPTQPAVVTLPGPLAPSVAAPTQALVGDSTILGNAPAKVNFLPGACVSAAIIVAACVIVWAAVCRVRKRELSEVRTGQPKDPSAGYYNQHRRKVRRALLMVPYSTGDAVKAGTVSGTIFKSPEGISTGFPSAFDASGRRLSPVHQRCPSQSTAGSSANTSQITALGGDSQLPDHGCAGREPYDSNFSSTARQCLFNTPAGPEDTSAADDSSSLSSASLLSSSSLCSVSSCQLSCSNSSFSTRSMSNFHYWSSRRHQGRGGLAGHHHHRPSIARSAVSLPARLSDTHSPSPRRCRGSPCMAADRSAMAGRHMVRKFLHGDGGDGTCVLDRTKLGVVQVARD